MAFLMLITVDVMRFLLHGFVLKTLWNWFVVPQFHLPSLGISAAIGISLILSLVVYRAEVPTDETVSERWTRLVGNEIFFTIMALLTGWITHHFV